MFSVSGWGAAPRPVPLLSSPGRLCSERGAFLQYQWECFQSPENAMAERGKGWTMPTGLNLAHQNGQPACAGEAKPRHTLQGHFSRERTDRRQGGEPVTSTCVTWDTQPPSWRLNFLPHLGKMRNIPSIWKALDRCVPLP